MTERNLRIFSDIESLQADFPGYVIWGQTIHGRSIYIAQAVDGTTDPWVVTSGSLNRLRAQLEEPDHRPAAGGHGPRQLSRSRRRGLTTCPWRQRHG